MTEHSISNLRAIYITNMPYRYPLPWMCKESGGEGRAHNQSYMPAINTGWHILPNLLWGHLASPRQWWDMVFRFEAISVKSISTKLFNPIPIQTALSFQGTNTFPAFNNTVYAMGYTDDIYETPWFPWHTPFYPGPHDMYYEWNPAFKEGLIPVKRSDKYDPDIIGAKSREELEGKPHNFPVEFPSQITQNKPSCYLQDVYRRQQLPTYWYHMPYCQYPKKEVVTAGWKGILTYFEEAWLDTSGAFWDPLNRPSELKELRPGKNMIEYSWSAHPSDEGIWFNTDRIAFLPPYPRPRPLQPPSGSLNMKGMPQWINPIGPGRPLNRYEHLKQMGLLKPGEAQTVSEDIMAPESHIGLPNWRDFPVVPMRWFLKEIQQSNPWAYENMHQIYYQNPSVSNCPRPSTSASGTKKGDAEIVGPPENTKFPGTEYEMYKYPPTQWFIKGVPLYDDKEQHIPVEMQMFMHTTVTVLGKPRQSALYAPSWGPINNQDLYSVNMDTAFGENYIRGRSGGARRTWFNPEEPRAERNVPYASTVLYPNETMQSDPVAFPVHAQTQCTILPNTDAYNEPKYPRKAWLSTAAVRVNIKDGELGERVILNDRDGGEDDVCSDCDDFDVIDD
uniref:VP1 n=1 Tax=Turdus pallidus Chaphamaparvovirus TaxID=2794492 RepID=A0A8A4XDM9_9VIRU|nr:MAG: VP1 [Turdus pallidus Chaphamaparvovirus]